MSTMLKALLCTDKERAADAAYADYVKARDAHPYHRDRLSQVAADFREVDREERQTKHARAVQLLQRTLDAVEELTAMDNAWHVQRLLEQAQIELDRCYVPENQS